MASGGIDDARAGDVPAFEPEVGVIPLPGNAGGWLWAFTCPTQACGCRVAVVLATEGDREELIRRGRPVAEAWRGDGSYAEAAARLRGVTAFAMDIDRRLLYSPVGESVLDVEGHPDVRRVADRIDDGVLDAIGRIWFRAKGALLPPDPGEGERMIEIAGYRLGDFVLWDDAHPMVCFDAFVLGERAFDALELYCVARNCACGEVVVEFRSLGPRGSAHPGRVEVDGAAVTLRPTSARQRARLAELWAAYCRRHPDHQQRFLCRSAIMHGLAERVVAARG